jgi:hypothetical protein
MAFHRWGFLDEQIEGKNMGLGMEELTLIWQRLPFVAQSRWSQDVRCPHPL